MSELVKSNVQKLGALLKADSVGDQFKSCLGESSRTFTASILSVYSTNDKLAECQPKDVIKEALIAASLNLPIIPSLGFAYIIPYNRKVGNSWVSVPQFQIGYKGIIQLALRSGQYKTVNTDVVYKGQLRSRELLTGYLDLSGEAESQEVIGYFAYLELLNGFVKTIYYTKEQVDAHAKRYSKTYGRAGSVWATNFDAMALKTVLKALLNTYGILSVDMQKAFAEDRDGSSDIESAEIVSEKTTLSLDVPSDIEEADVVTEKEPF